MWLLKRKAKLPFKCAFCGAKFQTNELLQAHISQNHVPPELVRLNTEASLMASGVQLGPVETIPIPNQPIPSPQKSDDIEIGTTVSFEDYRHFQETEATATDLESLVLLERSIAKGETRHGQPSKVMQYAVAVVVIVTGVIIGLVIAQSTGLLPKL